jgi:L-iditol 2-dehydrogenase
LRAVVKTKAETGALEVLDMPMPVIRPNEVLVKIKACGICGTDLGIYEWRPEVRFYRGTPFEVPRIIGHEPAGEVMEIGADIPKSWSIKIGDHVASDAWSGCGHCYYCRAGYFNMCIGERKSLGLLANGAMAEYCSIPFFNLFKVPDSLPFDEAAMLQPLSIATRGLETLVQFKAGNDVAIMGPGPIGLLEAMVMRAAGAGKLFVIGIAADKKRLELAKYLGFTTINASDQSAKEVIKDSTGGLGVDIVFDATSTGAPAEGIPLLKLVGQLVITAQVREEIMLPGRELLSREVIINTQRAGSPSAFKRAISMLSAGMVDVKPLITHQVNIESAVEGFKILQKREAMKVVITL